MYKKLDDHKSTRKTFLSSAKLIFNESDINKAFESMQKNVMATIKNYVSEQFSCGR